MQYWQESWRETIELLVNEKLPYQNSILIGDNASGKSEILRQYLKRKKNHVYFIDAVNRNFNIRNISPLHETIKYKESILQCRLMDENFNLKDTWSYYGTGTECIELIYLYYEEKLQKLFREFLGCSFSIALRETQDVEYDTGDIGKISNGYQAIARILLEMLYFQDTRPDREYKRAIVVIDEIDEYLSPKNAGSFYQFLKNKFADLDFIVATHSADVVAAASKCNLLLLHNLGLEVLDASDFKDIDDVMAIFKDVFGRRETEENDNERLLRKLLNNRIAGVWGENEIRQYESIEENTLSKVQKILYRQIEEW